MNDSRKKETSGTRPHEQDETNKPVPEGGLEEKERTEDPVQEASEESFPASDPPSWTVVSHAGPPMH